MAYLHWPGDAGVLMNGYQPILLLRFLKECAEDWQRGRSEEIAGNWVLDQLIGTDLNTREFEEIAVAGGIDGETVNFVG